MVKNPNEPIMFIEAKIEFPNKTKILKFSGTREFIQKTIMFYSSLGYNVKYRERWS